MILFLKYCFVINVALLFSSGVSSSQDADKVYNAVVNSVGLITDYDGVGSGFFVNSNTFITNKHVSSRINKRKAVIKLKDGTVIKPLKVIFEDESNDLAAFQTETYNHSVNLLENSEPKVGEKVFAIGNPASPHNVYEFTLTEGIINNITFEDIPSNDYPISSRIILHSASLNKGNSGGPLLNANGEVLGINSYYYVQGNNQFIAIHVSELIELLKKYKVSYNNNIFKNPSDKPIAGQDSSILNPGRLIPKINDTSGTVRISGEKNSGSPFPFILILIIGSFFIILLIFSSRSKSSTYQFYNPPPFENGQYGDASYYKENDVKKDVTSEKMSLNAFIKFNSNHYYIKQDVFVIGRDLDCDIVLSDNIFVSKRHCKIINKKGIYILSDLGSKNGTLLNNKTAYYEILNDRDVITIGNTDLFFFKLNRNLNNLV